MSRCRNSGTTMWITSQDKFCEENFIQCLKWWFGGGVLRLVKIVWGLCKQIIIITVKKHQCMLTCNYKPSIRDLFEFVGISIVTAQSQEPV